MDAAIASLAFIASLPAGTGVVLDYAVERLASGPLSHTALDALASRISSSDGSVKHLIRPQALAALLRGLGFQKVVDSAKGLLAGEHLVCATV